MVMEQCALTCYELRIAKHRYNELMDLVLDLGRQFNKPWYSYNDIEGYRKYMSLMFTIENPEKGEKFNEAVKSVNFSILNHFLLNTELGKEKFPGMTLKNLKIICLHKSNRW